MSNKISGQWIDLASRRVVPAEVVFERGIITAIKEIDSAPDVFILPGFVDAHVHIESSLLVPSEFARMAVIHGTVATVSDPHEIANVLGLQGVQFMLDNAAQVPFWFNFGAPSCVPATSFETAGAILDAAAVKQLLESSDIAYLSEMMNFPGVIARDEEVMKKIAAAHHLGKPVDGHAPGLSGEALRSYVAAGISTDHECYTLEEALEKISLGMKILIREGSAARNFETLIPLMKLHPDMLMFCSDDKHPDSLEIGHINALVANSVQLGYDLFDVLQVACLNPLEHYGLKHGQLRVGDSADFIVVKDLNGFEVNQTWIKGELVAENGVSRIASVEVTPPNHFIPYRIFTDDIEKEVNSPEPVMVCLDGQLITLREDIAADAVTPENDCLKLVVVNRYRKSRPAVCYLKNFGLKRGAIAGSVGHDSHNILAVGFDDASLIKAIGFVMQEKGALVACDANTEIILPLPVAGLMSNADAWEVTRQYKELDHFVRHGLGSTLRAPFMTLSFMALLVIPHLKLSDLGLFDGDRFEFVR